jgi:hypothetical protein
MARTCTFSFTKFIYNRYDIKLWYDPVLRTFDVETTTSNRPGVMLRTVDAECEKKPLRASLDSNVIQFHIRTEGIGFYQWQ